MEEKNQSPPTLAEIIHSLETWAPPGSAQSYDNVGLQVGDRYKNISRALVALDLTPGVIDEARQVNADVIITHHPLIFRPLRNLTTENWSGGLALKLAEAGIALYSIHTNLDAARGGVSFALARLLDLDDIRFLSQQKESLYKLATFVPESHFEQVRLALARAGAGRIGDYDSCAFITPGTGYFKPGEEANPFIGKSGGETESVREIKIEVEVERWRLNPILQALKESHPYEEVAYDLYPVEQPGTQTGLGALGKLAEPVPLARFLERVAERLGAASLRFTGKRDAMIERVAVCGGAGSDLIADARRAGAHAYVTADITYHKFFDVLGLDGAPKMALIDAGHYETEWITEKILVEWLKERFPDVEWIRTGLRTSPVESFSPSK